MPVNRKWPIASLLDACRRFQGEGNKNWITFEYVMLKDVNDTLEDAERLIELMKGIRAKMNLIPFNPFPGTKYERSEPEQVERFKDTLISGGLFASVRISRGQDILAACGQLRSAFGTARGTDKHVDEGYSTSNASNEM
jgi:23S rRNA (adenine2503-C2)-methyltransferase